MSRTPPHDPRSAALPQPRIDPAAWIAPGAVVVGDVAVAAEASVWFQAVLRGDSDAITIGPRTNIQDACVLHADPGFPCRIGTEVTVGHGAIVHGATVEDGALIGMGAIVMNGAVVGRGALVGVGAVVTEGTRIPPETLALGIPARVTRPLTAAETARIRQGVVSYLEKAARQKVEP